MCFAATGVSAEEAMLVRTAQVGVPISPTLISAVRQSKVGAVMLVGLNSPPYSLPAVAEAGVDDVVSSMAPLMQENVDSLVRANDYVTNQVWCCRSCPERCHGLSMSGGCWDLLFSALSYSGRVLQPGRVAGVINPANMFFLLQDSGKEGFVCGCCLQEFDQCKRLIVYQDRIEMTAGPGGAAPAANPQAAAAAAVPGQQPLQHGQALADAARAKRLLEGGSSLAGSSVRSAEHSPTKQRPSALVSSGHLPQQSLTDTEMYEAAGFQDSGAGPSRLHQSSSSSQHTPRKPPLPVRDCRKYAEQEVMSEGGLARMQLLLQGLEEAKVYAGVQLFPAEGRSLTVGLDTGGLAPGPLRQLREYDADLKRQLRQGKCEDFCSCVVVMDEAQVIDSAEATYVAKLGSCSNDALPIVRATHYFYNPASTAAAQVVRDATGGCGQGSSGSVDAVAQQAAHVSSSQGGQQLYASLPDSSSSLSTAAQPQGVSQEQRSVLTKEQYECVSKSAVALSMVSARGQPVSLAETAAAGLQQLLERLLQGPTLTGRVGSLALGGTSAQ